MILHVSARQRNSAHALWRPSIVSARVLGVACEQMASHADGGTPGVSDRYASLFFYMDSLAAAAAANFSGFLRQDLAGASYGLMQGCALTRGGAGRPLVVKRGHSHPIHHIFAGYTRNQKRHSYKRVVKRHSKVGLEVI